MQPKASKLVDDVGCMTRVRDCHSDGRDIRWRNSMDDIPRLAPNLLNAEM